MSTNGKTPRILQFVAPDERRQFGIETPFQRLAPQMEDILGDGGVLKEVIHEGEGPPVPMHASVSINFSGFIEYTDAPFETTNHLKYPRMMKLGKDVTLYGLELGLLTMKKGEFSRFLFKPKYAYGDLGCPPHIPPCATVLYEVQVLDFLDSAQVDDFMDLTLEEQNTAPLSVLLNVLDTQRSFGNLCFNKKRYEDARERYKQAMTLLQNREPEDAEEKKHLEEIKLPFLLNLSFTYLKLEKPQKALVYGQKALDINPQNTKALFRCGQACLEMKDYEKAQDYLTLAQAKKPFDPDINTLLIKLAHRRRRHSLTGTWETVAGENKLNCINSTGNNNCYDVSRTENPKILKDQTGPPPVILAVAPATKTTGHDSSKEMALSQAYTRQNYQDHNA